jgi:NAD(P)H-dependent FMN reductase
MLVQVITGTTRQARFSERVATWVEGELRDRTDFEIEIVDLRDHPLPFFEGVAPARDAAATTRTTRWRASGRPSTAPTASSSSPPSTTTAIRRC